MERERHALTDEQWSRIEKLLPGRKGTTGRPAADNRLFVNAVIYAAKTGLPWRDLPGRFGNWNSVWRRFDRWSRQGIWTAVFEAVQDPDLEWLLLDSTVIRAHQHAAGAKKGSPPAKPTANPQRPRATLSLSFVCPTP